MATKKQKKTIIIVGALALVAGVVIYFLFFRKGGGSLNLPDNVNERKWKDTYQYHYDQIMNLGDTGSDGEWRNDQKDKANMNSRSYEEQAHVDAVYLANQKYGTSVSSNWRPS